ncbi:unnamed protein product [Medioppia subpectinata]|uniref:Uncharacterized protein n=1 Tax=Medioppia subpectinata TaxID=1979941 RepID=A0A7R9KP92_9ACAR|nr:unnamed protein product [Medioppia subpectinata]CAG2107261.1 unnamed protein product [Medioppia subpectinata]
MHQKIVPKSKENSKKVHFDSARVAFQVEYDVPDDHSLRHKIPLWTEHWKRSKTSLVYHLARHVSCQQWARVVIAGVAVVALVVQMWQTLDAFFARDTVLSGQYAATSGSALSVTLCLPVVVPFVRNCVQNDTNDCRRDVTDRPPPTIRALFNQSLSPFSHKCKLRAKNALKSCGRARQWLRESRKCFTYATRDDDDDSDAPHDTVVHLLLQFSSDASGVDSLPQLRVHSELRTPDADDGEWLAVKQSRKFEVKYWSTRVRFLDACADYALDRQTALSSQDDCVEKCILKKMQENCFTEDPSRDYCLSRFATVRTEHVDQWETFCSSRDRKECASKAFMATVVDFCRREKCPKDCFQTDVQSATREEMTSDATETNVTLARRLAPELELREVRRVTCLALVSRLGGLLAFWLTLVWILRQFLTFLTIFIELFDIYLQKL